MVENKDCVFCRIARKEIKVDIVKETKNFIAFPDKNPMTKGHTLIIPKEHYFTLIDMPKKLLKEFIELTQEMAELRLSEGNFGFNLLMRNGDVAGQEVPHAHIHVIPRKKGDGVKFLPV